MAQRDDVLRQQNLERLKVLEEKLDAADKAALQTLIDGVDRAARTEVRVSTGLGDLAANNPELVLEVAELLQAEAVIERNRLMGMVAELISADWSARKRGSVVKYMSKVFASWDVAVLKLTKRGGSG